MREDLHSRSHFILNDLFLYSIHAYALSTQLWLAKLWLPFNLWWVNTQTHKALTWEETGSSVTHTTLGDHFPGRRNCHLYFWFQIIHSVGRCLDSGRPSNHLFVEKLFHHFASILDRNVSLICVRTHIWPLACSHKPGFRLQHCIMPSEKSTRWRTEHVLYMGLLCLAYKPILVIHNTP